MNKTNGKKVSEKGIKWGLTAILAIIIWGTFFFGINILPSDTALTIALIVWVVFIYFGWKFTFSMKLFAAGSFLGSFLGVGGTARGERFQIGLLATLIGFVVKFILSMVIGVFVTPYVIGNMLTPKVTAWLQRREELKGI